MFNFLTKELKKKLPKITNLNKVNWSNIDVLFTALPPGQSQSLAKNLKDRKLKIIDLSADFRLSDTVIYKKFYKKDHKAKDLINKSVYALPEFSKKFKRFKIIACPVVTLHQFRFHYYL